MAYEKTSRTVPKPLDPGSLRGIRYNLLVASMFFEEPIQVEVPELDLTIGVGHGLGGFSWNLFYKGEACTACGRCCQHAYPHWIWLWHPNDPKPEGLPTIELILQGERIVYNYNIQHEYGACVYLDPLILDGVHQIEVHGIPMHVCSLHGVDNPLDQVEGDTDRLRLYDEDLKPQHCRMDPFTRPKERTYSGRGEKVILERNLPGRNFRKPQCPIKLSEIPATQRVFDSDRRNLMRLYRNYGHLPGAHFDEGMKLWSSLVEGTSVGNPPTSTTFLEDYVG